VTKLAGASLEVLPVDQPGKLHQRMAQVDLMAETGAPEVLRRLKDQSDEAASNRRLSSCGSDNSAIYNIW
jgi:hypothetical protein